MRWSDEAVVLSTRRHGEGALLVHVLTRAHGRHAGLAHGGQRPKGRAVYQVGNRLSVTWSARLPEHLGTFSAELMHSPWAALADAPARLGGLSAAAALADAALPEREPHAVLFERLAALAQALEENRGWMPLYVRWELDLLAELGFGLDLSTCAATGATEELVYVSPNSGRAVSRAAGSPYSDRLLPLPPFLASDSGALRPDPRSKAAEVMDGLALTGFFLDTRIFGPHGHALPPARARFVALLRQFVTISSG